MSTLPRHIVTAIVVSHDGEAWLGELVAGLRQQRRQPDRILAVDTGSHDNSKEILARGFSPNAIVAAERGLGFGAAVQLAASHLPPAHPDTIEWLWLLHDDCAPTPAALHEMLTLLEEVPAAAAVGPKLRSWPRGRQLLELGVTISGSGMRETGLEHAEFDQGQHDVVRETLAVSTAGMLVRRDVFERLGGFDPKLKLFRDDIDFGWRLHRAGLHVITCPDAIVFHAEAGARGLRRLDAVGGVRPRRADRIGGIYTLLVNCSIWLLPLVFLRMVIGSLARVAGLLVAKWPDAAYDEFRALLTTILRLDRVLRGRLRRTRGRKVARRRFHHLFPPPWVGIQHAIDSLSGILGKTSEAGSHAGSSRRKRHRVVESGPVAEEAEQLDDGGPGLVKRTVTRPPVLLLLGLLVVSLIAGRNLLLGPGSLSGGALLSAPDGAMDLWRRYLESWHPVELGSGRAAPPYVAVIAALGTLFFGKVWLAIDVLLLAAVPLAGLTAYLCGREVLKARPVRLWAAGTYALIPAVTGAVSEGRLGTCVAAILLPLLGLTVVRTLRTGSWSAAWTAALVLGIMTAFVPMAYLVGLLLGLIAILSWRPRRISASRLAIVMVAPPLLLLPWLPVLVANPWTMLGEAGRTAQVSTDGVVPGYVLALGSPGGPGAAPFWILGVLGVVALAALLRRDRVAGVVASWMVAVLGLCFGLVQSRLSVDAEWLATPVPAWPGFASVLVLGGWVAALAYSTDGVGQVFHRISFSWRQPTAGILAILAVGAPALAVGWWVLRGSDDPLQRTESAVPAYIASAQESGTRPRAVVLRVVEGRVDYALLRSDSARLGDAEMATGAKTLGSLDKVISAILGDSHREDAAEQLASFGIGHVYMPPRADERAAQRLDTTPGLTRTSAPARAGAWRVDDPAAAFRMVRTTSGGESTSQALKADETDTGSTLRVPAGSEGRRLVLTEAYDEHWQAKMGGRELTPIRHNGWAQAFELPGDQSQTEQVTVSRASVVHGRLLILQGVIVAIVLVFALPTRRRQTEGTSSYTQDGRHGRTDEPMPDPTRADRPETPLRVPQEVRR